MLHLHLYTQSYAEADLHRPTCPAGCMLSQHHPVVGHVPHHQEADLLQSPHNQNTSLCDHDIAHAGICRYIQAQQNLRIAGVTSTTNAGIAGVKVEKYLPSDISLGNRGTQDLDQKLHFLNLHPIVHQLCPVLASLSISADTFLSGCIITPRTSSCQVHSKSQGQHRVASEC